MRIFFVCCLFIVPVSHVISQEVRFDFDNADLRTVIQAVAEFTGKNFLVDPDIKGTVTVVAPEPLTEDQAYKAFQSILEVNGFMTVESDGIIKIVPVEKGKVQDTGRDDQPSTINRDDLVTRVIYLTYISAERLVPILRPLVAPYGHLAADTKSSFLIVTDRAGNVGRIEAIVRRLDRPVSSGELEMIPLTYASAERLAELVSRLYLVNGENEPNSGVMIMADARTNSLVVRADASTRQEIMGLALQLDAPAGSSGSTNVIYLKNADAEKMVEVLQNTLNGPQQADSGTGTLSARVNITADVDINALVVTASKADFLTIEEVVRQLDIRRLQVYVEALIAEVSTDKARQIGVQFQAGDGLRGDRRGVVGGSNFDVASNILDVLVNPLAAGAGLNLGFIDGSIILPDGTEVANLSVLATALESMSGGNVLSTPNILTMDNQEAEIVIGQNVPFITGSFSQIDQGTSVNNPFQTIERQDVGLTLRIRPQITEGSAIKLDIFQEVSSVAQKGEALDIVTNTRSLTTTIVAENNHMIVLGGLIQDDMTINNQKVPLLGDIPVLGNLFRFKGRSRSKTNLLIFLRPRIIRGVADMDEPTRQKYNYLNNLSSQQQWSNDGARPDAIEQWEFIAPVNAGSGAETGDE